jgi:hypothetical protein
MSNQMHPKDLRALLAALHSAADYQIEKGTDPIKWADNLLAKLERTAPKTEPTPSRFAEFTRLAEEFSTAPKEEQPVPKAVPRFCNPDAGKPRLTPLEVTIQHLMAPDKNGNVGRPIRHVAMESFGHIENRTLDALWKFAEGSFQDCSGCPTVDGVKDLVARAESAEGCLAEEYDRRKAAEARVAELLDPGVMVTRTEYGMVQAQFAQAEAEVDRLKESLRLETNVAKGEFTRSEELWARIQAIDAAKKDQPACPVTVITCPYPSEEGNAFFANTSWGAQGWESAAALRVDLNTLQESYDRMAKCAAHVVYMHATGMLENLPGESYAINNLRGYLKPTDVGK